MIHVTRTDRMLTVVLPDDGTADTELAVQTEWQAWVRSQQDLPGLEFVDMTCDDDSWVMRFDLVPASTEIAPPPPCCWFSEGMTE